MQGTLAARITIAAALAVTPLTAEVVYVPALDPAVATDGSTSATELWISNPTGGPLTFKTTFLANDTDGTEGPASGVDNSVPSQRIFNVVNAGQGGKVGLMAVEVANGLTVDARVITTAQGGGVVTTLAPVISDGNKLAADETAQLLALERDPDLGKIVDLGVVNLASSSSQCTISFFRTDGSQIGSTAVIALKPLSLRHFADALGVIGATKETGVRAQASCTKPFFVYGAQFFSTNSHVLFVTPSTAPEGEAPPSENCPPADTGIVCYEFPGVVHTSTKSRPDHSIVVAPPEFAYSRLRLHLEIEINGFAPPSSGAHGLVYLVRDINKDMYANVFVQGPGTNSIVLRHGMGQTHGQKAKLVKGFKPTSGTTYSLDYLYDPIAKSIVLTLSEGGTEILRLTSAPNVNKVHIDAGQKIVIGLSNPGNNPAIEPASFGWVYKNLKLELEP